MGNTPAFASKTGRNKQRLHMHNIALHRAMLPSHRVYSQCVFTCIRQAMVFMQTCLYINFAVSRPTSIREGLSQSRSKRLS